MFNDRSLRVQWRQVAVGDSWGETGWNQVCNRIFCSHGDYTLDIMDFKKNCFGFVCFFSGLSCGRSLSEYLYKIKIKRDDALEDWT